MDERVLISIFVGILLLALRFAWESGVKHFESFDRKKLAMLLLLDISHQEGQEYSLATLFLSKRNRDVFLLYQVITTIAEISILLVVANCFVAVLTAVACVLGMFQMTVNTLILVFLLLIEITVATISKSYARKFSRRALGIEIEGVL